MTKQPRVREIARNLSLSPGTVSKALRGSAGLVSRRTARMILEYCRANGYMSKAETDRVLLKLEMQDPNQQVFTMSCRGGLMMYDAAFTGICERMQEHGLYTSSYVISGANAMSRFPYDSAGVAIVMGHVAQRVLGDLAERKLPAVLVDNRIAGGASAVNSNNLEGASQAVALLANMGHRRIAFMCNHEDICSPTYTFHQRQAGYIAGSANAGMKLDNDLLVLGEGQDYEGDGFDWDQCLKDLRQLAQRLLSLDPLPTAVVAANDMHACILREEAVKQGMRVPEDLSIVGYDGQHHLMAGNPAAHPAVSTMVVRWHEMGRETVNIALDLLCDPDQPAKYLEVPVMYEDNGTVAPPRDS